MHFKAHLNGLKKHRLRVEVGKMDVIMENSKKILKQKVITVIVKVRVVWADRASCIFPSGNENYTGIAARDTANALRVLAGAVRGVAAGTKNQQTQKYILSTAQQVNGTS